MLNLEQIKLFYPKTEIISERGMLREYLQYKILSIVFKTRHAEKLSFIGGTAIRIIYGSDRFSEDLDFDHFGLSQENFGNLTKVIKNSLLKEGFEVETRNVYQEAFRCYLKIPKLLFDHGLSGHKRERLLIRIDTTLQDLKTKPVLKIINKFGIFSEVKVNPADILLSQKIEAILRRKRVMGRDLYDIIYLSSLATPNMWYLEQKLGIGSMEGLRHRINQRLSKYNLDNLSQDILPFVADESKLEIVRKFNQWFKNWAIG